VVSDADILIVAGLVALAAGLGWYIAGGPFALIIGGTVGFLLGVFGQLAEQRSDGSDE
jgi:hypothetical protein